MMTLIAVFGLISLTFAILYFRTRHRFLHFMRRQNDQQAALQEELKTLKAKIQSDSRDPVTQLLGWSLLEDRINLGIKECTRFQLILGILVIDIDSFKLVNNAMGYQIGNEVLLQTAERLEGCIRQADSISRQSKDTFVVLLAKLSKHETAAIIIQRMLQVMSQPFEIDGRKLTVTVSIGAAFYPGDGATRAELLHNAEYAMLLAKARGKHTYQFYQERLQAEGQRELALYNSIASDSFLDELALVFQPVMNVVDQTLSYVDTQIIWQHSVVGSVSGEELFTYADKHRKLNKITEQVLAKAGKQFLEWRAMGLNPQMIAVPLLLKQLENTPFIYRLSHIMQEMKLQPAWVMLEIREDSQPVSLDILEKSFNMLQYLGVKIAIDRFGAGSFSLRYLKAFSVQYLKLDPALTSDIALNDQTRALTQAVVGFAAHLLLSVIATGVESEEQAAALKSIGVVLMQGQLVSQPLSDVEMAGKMTKV